MSLSHNKGHVVKETKWLKKLRNLLSVVFVGALGTGLWNYVFQPSLGYGRDFSLNLVSLGLESYKLAVYLEVARGFHEKTTVLTYGLIVFLIFGFCAVVVVFSKMALAEVRENHRSNASRIDRLKEKKKQIEVGIVAEHPASDFDAELRALDEEIKIRDRILKRIGITWYILTSLVVFFVLTVGIQTITTTYENNAITHYHQMLAITSP